MSSGDIKDIGSIKVVEVKDNEDGTCTIIFDVPDDFKDKLVAALGWDEWTDEAFNQLTLDALNRAFEQHGYEYEYKLEDKMSKKTKKVEKKPNTKTAKKVPKPNKKQITAKLEKRLDELAAKVSIITGTAEADCSLTDIEDADSIESLATAMLDFSDMLHEVATEMHSINYQLEKLWAK